MREILQIYALGQHVRLEPHVVVVEFGCYSGDGCTCKPEITISNRKEKKEYLSLETWMHLEPRCHLHPSPLPQLEVLSKI